MYYHIHRDIECSQCGAINDIESVSRNTWGKSETIIRCLQCGHEKVTQTVTFDPLTEPVVYNAPNPNDKELF